MLDLDEVIIQGEWFFRLAMNVVEQERSVKNSKLDRLRYNAWSVPRQQVVLHD